MDFFSGKIKDVLQLAFLIKKNKEMKQISDSLSALVKENFLGQKKKKKREQKAKMMKAATLLTWKQHSTVFLNYL